MPQDRDGHDQTEQEKEDELRRDFARLIKKGDVAGLRQFKNEHHELPSLAGETFNKLEVTRLDLSHIDLSNTEWNSCILDKATFRRGNLEGAYFTGCTILESVFAEMTMDGAAIDGSVLRNCTFRSMKLEDVEITGTELNGCTLEDLDLVESIWESVTVSAGKLKDVRGRSGSWSGITFRDVELDNADLGPIELQGAVASGDLLPGFNKLTGRRKTIR